MDAAAPAAQPAQPDPDPAAAAPVTLDPPSIGVPAIPVAPDPGRPPVSVPSVTGPDASPTPDRMSPIRLAPLPVGEPGEPSEPSERSAVDRSATDPVRVTRRGVTTTTVTVADGETRFAPGVADQLGTYVYLLVDPRTGRPFHVGRGRGDRCFRHVAAARGDVASADGEADGAAGTTDFAGLDRIRQVENHGRPVRIDVLRYGLSPDEARLVEAATVDALGLPGPAKLGSQRTPAAELSARLAKRAKFKRAHQVVLLRVGPTGSVTEYEAVRHHWRIGQRWVDLDSPRSPQWAVVVAGDLVASVYRIEGWEPAADGTGTAGDRYSFVGFPDPELERRYGGRSVAAYLGSGAPSPVTYVWCGPHWVNAPR